ncbi:hypothetical protein NBRC111894_393 [Sporolactobacillus inulinus]|uniref:Uncharacterized protein n=1 Tax=Sporolactobacillus inulinus TaxID=2078 RepID=A0A4Y1Z754_9BACL|nr:hypothetical protein NBRC111894_393 [Sporolactobacillus inulinus]
MVAPVDASSWSVVLAKIDGSSVKAKSSEAICLGALQPKKKLFL